MDCSDLQRLSAYHDGELSEADALAVRDHLTECGKCAAALAEIARVSRAFDGLRGASMSPIGLARAHQAADAAADDEGRRGVVRIAGVLTGIAASVLVVASAWLLEGRGPGDRATGPAPLPAVARAPAAAPEWERLAMTLDATGPSVDGQDVTPMDRRPALVEADLADWMLRNLNR